MSSIREIQARVGEVNAANGWTMGALLRDTLTRVRGHLDPNEGNRPDVEQRVVDHQIAVLALITTEVAEAIEDIRAGRQVDETNYTVQGHPVDTHDAQQLELAGYARKPEGVPSELADVVIRALDFADTWGIDLESAIEEKLAYNATRGHRHGGKRL